MSVKVEQFIQEILHEMGDKIDGSGYWSQADVLSVLDYKQKEMSRITENIRAKSATLEPAADDTEITFDTNGNVKRIISGYRLQTTEGPVKVYTQEQIERYDYQWRTRTGSLILGLVPELADPGKARIYPIVDNADNDIIVYYIKLATTATAAGNLEIPDIDIQGLKYGVKAELFLFEQDGKNETKAAMFKKLYGLDESGEGNHAGALREIIRRVSSLREGTYRTMRRRTEIERSPLPDFKIDQTAIT
jgi:hypothetical protein